MQMFFPPFLPLIPIFFKSDFRLILHQNLATIELQGSRICRLEASLASVQENFVDEHSQNAVLVEDLMNSECIVSSMLIASFRCLNIIS